MSSNKWQNIKDDLYAHQLKLRWLSGHVAFGVALISLIVMLVLLTVGYNPSAPTVTLFFVGVACLLGWGAANTTLPLVIGQRNQISYRYRVFVDSKRHSREQIDDWMQKHGMTFHCCGSTADALQRNLGQTELVEYKLTRAEHAMLAQMRF